MVCPEPAISDVSSTWLYWPEVGNDASRVWLFFHLAKRFANCLTSRSSSRGSFGFVMEDCSAAFGKGREGGVWGVEVKRALSFFPAGDVRDKNRLRIGGRERKKRATKGRVGCVLEGLKCVDSSEGLRRPWLPGQLIGCSLCCATPSSRFSSFYSSLSLIFFSRTWYGGGRFTVFWVSLWFSYELFCRFSAQFRTPDAAFD